MTNQDLFEIRNLIREALDTAVVSISAQISTQFNDLIKRLDRTDATLTILGNQVTASTRPIASFSRVEFLLSEHIAQAEKDYEENRRLWQEQQSDIAVICKRMERGFEENHRGFEESRQLLADGWAKSWHRFEEGMAAMRQEMAARDQILDRRIADLLSAIREHK